MTARRLLVTGASGFLGQNLCLLARTEYEVIGLSHKHKVLLPDIQSVSADLTDFDAVSELIEQLRPDRIIHTAANSNPNACEQEPTLSSKINVDATVHLACLCSQWKIPFVFTSTDLVFDGTQAPYKPNDPVSPISEYGRQKAQAENAIQDIHPSAVVCRMPLMFGHALAPAQSFLQPMLRAMREGNKLRLFVDEFRSPLSGLWAARGLLLALEKGSGVMHLGGPERISRYDFARLVAEVFKTSKADLIACHQRDVTMPAPRPQDVSLKSHHATKIGFVPPSLLQQLQEVRQQIESDSRDQ